MAAEAAATPEPQATLHCPYCRSGLHPEAIACAACGRDLAAMLPMMRDQRRLEARLQSLQEQVEALQVKLESTALAPAMAAEAAAPAAAPAAAVPRRPYGRLFACISLAFVVLVVLHQAFVIRIDAPVLMFRIASVSVPFLCVIALRPRPLSLPAHALAGFLLGIVAVFAMSASIAYVDHVPILPTGPREVQDVVEFTLSIALSHLAGELALRVVERRARAAAALALAATRQRADGTREALPIKEQASLVQNLGEAAVPVLAAGGAIYGAISGVLN